MKYLKYFEDLNNDDRLKCGGVKSALSEEDFNKTCEMLKETLNKIGVKVKRNHYNDFNGYDFRLKKERTIPVCTTRPDNIQYFKVNFELCFTEIRDSILDIISSAITDEYTVPEYKVYSDEDRTTVVLCEVEVENSGSCFCTINPKSTNDAYNQLLYKLIEIMESTTDNIKIKNTNIIYCPVFKNAIINYIKNVLCKEHKPSLFDNNKIEIVTDEKFYKDIYTDLCKLDNFNVFNKIKSINIPFYNKLMSYNKQTSIAADLGALGF